MPSEKGAAIRNRTHILGFILALLFLLTACGGETISSESPPDQQYEEGLRLMKKERFVEAVERFRSLKSRYPYSKFAALAALKIGDAHYQDESYIEAASAYKVFRELYPKHEMAAYALYRVGESNYNQVPGSADRDLDAAYAAIDAYKELLKEYPTSPDLEDAKKKIGLLREKLADKEDYIGNFYFIREIYNSAAGRYRYLLEQYPDSAIVEKALYRLAFSYDKIGEYIKATETIDRLEAEYPKTSFMELAEKLRARLGKDKAGVVTE